MSASCGESCGFTLFSARTRSFPACRQAAYTASSTLAARNGVDVSAGRNLGFPAFHFHHPAISAQPQKLPLYVAIRRCCLDRTCRCQVLAFRGGPPPHRTTREAERRRREDGDLRDGL